MWPGKSCLLGGEGQFPGRLLRGIPRRGARRQDLVAEIQRARWHLFSRINCLLLRLAPPSRSACLSAGRLLAAAMDGRRTARSAHVEPCSVSAALSWATAILQDWPRGPKVSAAAPVLMWDRHLVNALLPWRKNTTKHPLLSLFLMSHQMERLYEAIGWWWHNVVGQRTAPTWNPRSNQEQGQSPSTRILAKEMYSIEVAKSYSSAAGFCSAAHIAGWRSAALWIICGELEFLGSMVGGNPDASWLSPW